MKLTTRQEHFLGLCHLLAFVRKDESHMKVKWEELDEHTYERMVAVLLIPIQFGHAV
jgi:hypothetical protein